MKIGWLIVVAALIFATFRALKTHYICPKCGTKFKVNVLKYIFAPHFMGKRMAKCPNCKHSELLSPKWDKA